MKISYFILVKFSYEKMLIFVRKWSIKNAFLNQLWSPVDKNIYLQCVHGRIVFVKFVNFSFGVFFLLKISLEVSFSIGVFCE